MSHDPKNMTDRPDGVDCASTDTLGDLLASLRMTTLVYGRIELAEPWGLRFPDVPDAASLYLLVRGSAVLEAAGSEEPTELSAGDVALLPKGGSHTLRDHRGSPLHDLSVDGCRGAKGNAPLRMGGKGAQTTLVAGTFRYDGGRAAARERAAPRRRGRARRLPQRGRVQPRLQAPRGDRARDLPPPAHPSRHVNGDARRPSGDGAQQQLVGRAQQARTVRLRAGPRDVRAFRDRPRGTAVA